MIHEPLTIRPECGGTLRRVLYPAGIVFKGSGFYKTDHHASGSVADSNGHAKNGNEKAAESTESGTSTASEGKPAPTAEKSTGSDNSTKSENKVASPTK